MAAPSPSHYAAALSGGRCRGSQQTLSIAKQFGVETEAVVLLRFLSLLCIPVCIGAELTRGFLCCFQDCHVRRESGHWERFRWEWREGTFGRKAVLL